MARSGQRLAALDDPVAHGLRRRSRPRRLAQLATDIRDVSVHRVGAEYQALSDLGVGQTLGDEAQYLKLTATEIAIARCACRRRERRVERVDIHRAAKVREPTGGALARRLVAG